MDYSQVFETLEIESSFENETLTVTIPILEDNLAEPKKSFTVELLSVGDGSVIEMGRSVTTIDIIDNDGN